MYGDIMLFLETKRPLARLVSLNLLFLALLVMIQSTCAYQHFRYSSALLNVTMNWSVSSDSLLDNVDLLVFVPSNSSNQEVLVINVSEPYELTTDGKMHIHLYNITNRVVNGNFLVRTDYITRIERNKPQKEELTQYLNETKLVVITRPIAYQSNKFNATFPEKIVEMSRWIYENVEYAVQYSDVNVSEIYENTIPSDRVFENKIGVCDEFSHLFVAFARASNIPSRVINGFTLVGDKWIPHSWAEVYYDKYGWIEVDPTFNEFMNLDAMRLRLGSGVDQSVLIDKVNATTKSNAKTLSFNVNTNIEVINYSSYAPLSLDIRFPPQEELSTTQPALVRIVNNGKDPIYTLLAIEAPQEVMCNCSRYLFLEPGIVENEIFNLYLPQLSPNVRYVFPITVFTDYTSTDTSFVRVKITDEGRGENSIGTEETSTNLRYFIAVFFIAVIGLVVIAILRRW
jgi:hypothetical protein